jgi:hypothetical protein
MRTDDLKRLLIRLKAPLVLAIALALLVLSWIWVAGTEWSGRRRLAAAVHVPGTSTKAHPVPPALPEVNRLLAVKAVAPTGSVFHSVTIDRFIERRETQRKAEEAARLKAEKEAEALRKARAAAAAKVPVPGAPAVREPPPKRFYALTYNGLVTTPDRQEVGIIGILPPGAAGKPGKPQSAMVSAGDPCLDATVTQLTRSNATLQLKMGTTVVLEAGKPERVEEPLLHAP